MGGHEEGALASQTAVNLIHSCFKSSPHNFDEHMAIEKTHRELEKKHQFVKRPMGTTIVGIVIGGNQLTVFNVGDSRAHHISGSKVEELTVGDRMMLAGGTRITQCLGGGMPKPTPHCREVSYQRNDKVVLSSDGMNDFISGEEILSSFNVDWGNHASRLCQMAQDNGSSDDISAIVISIE